MQSRIDRLLVEACRFLSLAQCGKNAFFRPGKMGPVQAQPFLFVRWLCLLELHYCVFSKIVKTIRINERYIFLDKTLYKGCNPILRIFWRRKVKAQGNRYNPRTLLTQESKKLVTIERLRSYIVLWPQASLAQLAARFSIRIGVTIIVIVSVAVDIIIESITNFLKAFF